MTATATEKPLDGWTEWEGDAQCPTGVDCFVEVELRDGTTCEGRCDSFRWRHLTSSRSMRDIVAYRVVPADQPRGDVANQPEDGGVQASLQYRTLGANETIREGDEKRTKKGWELSDAWKGSPYARNPALHYRRPIEYGVWFDWQGGECPVDLETVVDVRLESGDEDGGKATSFYWNHDGDGADIVAYRVVPADQPAEPEKQPQHTPGPWGVEQTQTTNWIGPLRADGKVDRIVAHNDRHNLTPAALAERDANARLIAQAPSFESTIEECLKQRDEAEAAADELASLILGEPVDWTFHNEAWQRAVEQLRDAKSEPDCTLPTTSPHEGCHVVQAEKQPQPGWWRAVIDGETTILWVFEIPGRGLRWVDSADATDAIDCGHVELIRHLPDCTGFDYVPPPEQTPAEKRLEELGIHQRADTYIEGTFEAVYEHDEGIIVAVDENATAEQLKRIADVMEGGAA